MTPLLLILHLKPVQHMQCELLMCPLLSRPRKPVQIDKGLLAAFSFSLCAGVLGFPLLGKCSQALQPILCMQGPNVALFFQFQCRCHIHLQSLSNSPFSHPNGDRTLKNRTSCYFELKNSSLLFLPFNRF